MAKWQTGKLKNLINGLSHLTKNEVAVGIVEKQIRSGTTTQASIAAHLEEGPVGKKKKSWPTFRPGIKDAKYKGRIKPLMQDVIRGNAKAGLNRFGDVAQLKIKSNIQGIKSPGLEPSTIKRKGSSNPLVETGGLKKSVAYKIQRRS